VRAEKSSAALAGLIDDFRCFMRLKGLLGIWSGGVGLYRNPPKDLVLRVVGAGQITAIAAFQAMENAAYLASKGVIRWAPQKIGRWFLWSARFWMVHVMLEFVKLLRVRQLREGRAKAILDVKVDLGTDEKVKVVEERGKEEKMDELAETKWWRDLYVNAAWAPLTVHYSTASVNLSEGTIAFLGAFCGWMSLSKAWEATKVTT